MTTRSALAAALLACVMASDAGAAGLDAGIRAFRAHDLDLAVHELQPLAALGDPDAAYYLGTIYDDETDRAHRDDNRAYALLARAARAGNPQASAALLRMRTRGKVSFMFETYGLSQSQIDALVPLRDAAQSGKPDAISTADLTRLAVATCESMGRRTAAGAVDTARDNQPALDWLERAAGAGQPQAQFLVGLSYLGSRPCYVGKPTVPDIATAQKWLRKSAAQGIIRAQVMVAQLERDQPPGLVSDAPAALAGLRSTAAAEDPSAMALLADFTERGIGAPADAAEARRLREKAAALGDTQAMRTLATSLGAKGASGEQLHQAFEMMQRCAQATNPHCEYDLGMMYIQGRGTSKDTKQFVKWLELAASHDSSTAATHIGQYLLFDTGPDRDVKRGIGYLREGVSHGHAVAMFRLGDEYRTGEHLKQDLSKAWALYTLAANRGFDDARNTLDQMRPQVKAEVIERGERLAASWRQDDRSPGSWDWRALAVGPRDESDRF